MRKPHSRQEFQPSRVSIVLRQLLTAGAEEKKELTTTLKTILVDPRELLTCGILDPQHPLHHNAQIVDDALESVTNGMEDPAIIEELHKVPDDSLVGPWKQCVLALKSLYAGDHSAVKAAYTKIPEDTPPRKLAALALEIAERGDRAQLSGSAARSFVAELLESPDFVGSAGEQLEEALEMGMADLFIETAAMLIRDLSRDYPNTTSAFALWCCTRLAEEDHSLMPLLKRFKGILGEAETLRVAALGVMDEDADAALFYWLKYLITALEENSMNADMLSAALGIAADIGDQGTLSQGRDDPEEISPEDKLLQIQFAKLFERVSKEIGLRFATLSGPALRSPDDCRGVAKELVPEDTPHESTFSVPEAPNRGNRTKDQTFHKSNEPLQLELFA